MVLVFPSAVVRETVSTPWEMPESKLTFSPRTVSIHWGLVTECCPFLTNNPQGICRFNTHTPPHTLQLLKLEARGTLALLWILRNLALKVASVLLQVLSRDVIKAVNGSFKQRQFPGAGFCHPVSVFSRGRIHHGYGRLWLAVQKPATIAPSRSRGPRTPWLRGERNSFSRFCSFSLYLSLRTKLTIQLRWVGMLVRKERGNQRKQASHCNCSIYEREPQETRGSDACEL